LRYSAVHFAFAPVLLPLQSSIGIPDQTVVHLASTLQLTLTGAKSVQSKLDALEKQRKDLAVEHNKLDVERMKHIREVKLQWDYNLSPYNLHSNPAPLRGQYVLMSMFGKGGFAAVCCRLSGRLKLYHSRS
jgi:hypothetical protein